MNNHNLWKLYLFDIKKSFRENKLKMGIACFLFMFLANITVKNCLVQQNEGGYLSYWIMLLGGMSEYIKTETSIFRLPVSWFLFYAYLFFLTGFYPVSDLYSGGSKTLLLAESRNKWMVSKLLWIVTTIILYYVMFLLCLFVNAALLGNKTIGFAYVAEVYGMISDIRRILMIFFVVPILITIAMSFMQFVISIIINALSGYIISITILVVSTYWMKPFLIGNYLMLVRNEWITSGGMKETNGMLWGIGISIIMAVIGSLIFMKKDIYKTSERR